MLKKLRILYATATILSLVAAIGRAMAAPKEKDKPGGPHEPKGQQQEKAKKHKDVSGKKLLGDKIKHNGRHKLEDHGKFTASVDVTNGKVGGVKVKHADKGDVAVTKYKSTKQMAAGPSAGGGVFLAQYGSTVVTLWIGYAFIDDWGYEVIYWFPVDMVIDADYGAIPYDDYYGYGY